MSPKELLITKGGSNEERIYLKNLKFTLHDGTTVDIRESTFPGVDMGRSFGRHKARYNVAFLFVPVGRCKVLDFPCGSGYAAEIFTQSSGVNYEGVDSDQITLEYAEKVYGSDRITFRVGDLRSPNLPKGEYDVIACCEGYEHIDAQYQTPLLDAFYQALKPGGTLVVTSPENPTGKSGKSNHNPFHLSELTKEDFLDILYWRFGKENVSFLENPTFSSTGRDLNMIIGICRKPKNQ